MPCNRSATEAIAARLPWSVRHPCLSIFCAGQQYSVSQCTEPQHRHSLATGHVSPALLQPEARTPRSMKPYLKCQTRLTITMMTAQNASLTGMRIFISSWKAWWSEVTSAGMMFLAFPCTAKRQQKRSTCRRARPSPCAKHTGQFPWLTWTIRQM